MAWFDKTDLIKILNRVKNYVDTHSSGGATYTAGDGISISDDNAISTTIQIIPIARDEYDALPKEEKKNTSKFYFITNDDSEGNALSLEDLLNVLISAPKDNQVLRYNNASKSWVNSDESNNSYTAGQGINIDYVNHVISTEYQLIRITKEEFDGLDEETKNDTTKFYFIIDGDDYENSVSLAELSDVSIAGLADSHILQYDAVLKKWKNVALDIKGNLVDLLDVEVSNLTDGQILAYDAESKKFKNKDENQGGASSWGDIENKPFNTIGDGLTVTNNVLAVNKDWSITDTEPTEIAEGKIVFVYE